MATVPRDEVNVQGSSFDVPNEPSARVTDSSDVDLVTVWEPEWRYALDHPVWRTLEAQAGDMLSYSDDRIMLTSEASKQLGGEVYRVALALLGHIGYDVTGDHVPPFSLLVTRA